MKNGKPNALEARLERLEAELKEIKAMLLKQQEPKEPWWKSVVGTFANNPAAEEVRKMVEETREKERRKARRKRAKQQA